MAPSLVRAYRQYAKRGVVFLGLAECDLDDCKGFVRKHHIPWPNGYGASETMRSLVNGNPTVVVIGRDGKVAWNDAHSRYQHRMRLLPEELGRAIEAALGDTRTDTRTLGES